MDAHVQAVDTRPSFLLPHVLGTRLLYMDMSSIELIPEHCRYISDGYINPIMAVC